MNKLHVLSVAAFCSFALAAAAQDTNSLRTDLGVLEAQTGVLIIKGFGPVGSVIAGTATISVRDKESTDTGSGLKLHGLAIEIEDNAQARERIYVDYDEIDSLLNAINFLIKIKYDVTALPGFEAGYTTKAGLRVIANSIRRDGAIQHSLQYYDEPRVMLTSIQMTQLYDLIELAKKNLDVLRKGK